MKKFIILASSILLASTMIFAQENTEKDEEAKPQYLTKTLIGGTSNLTFSGYGAPTVGFSRINGNWVTTAGGRGGVIINGINHGIVLGFAGEGVAYPNGSKTITGETFDESQENIEIGWGGLLIEYHFMPRSLIHFSIGTTIGAGGITLYDRNSVSYNEEGEVDEEDYYSDSFFVAQPEIAMYLNVTKFFRLGAAATYRYAYGLDTEGISNTDFSNFGGKVMFQFGWF